MRLLNATTHVIEEFVEGSIPLYAILSHTWGRDEVSFRDIHDLRFARTKYGFAKILHTCNQALSNHLQYVWIDTCCIDKSSSAELQEAINSMYRYYVNAAICYVFLEDVEDDQYDPENAGSGPIGNKARLASRDFLRSRWFRRGWTLQELIAPLTMTFFTCDWTFIGTKRELLKEISAATKIDTAILDHTESVTSVSVAQRMSWAAHRKTTRVEDQAYSMLGIFNINMPMLYGEGSKAFMRLQDEIMRVTNDHSILAWGSTKRPPDGQLLAGSPADFGECNTIVPWGRPGSFETTNRGLRIALPILSKKSEESEEYFAILNCRYESDLTGTLALRLGKYVGSHEYYALDAKDEMPQRWSNVAQRLEFIPTDHLKSASRTVLEITRVFEPETAKIKFWIQLSGTTKDGDPAAQIVDVYPKIQWDTTSNIFQTLERSRFRAAILLHCRSGKDIIAVFGFDRVKSTHETSKRQVRDFIPAIWMKERELGSSLSGVREEIQHWPACAHDACSFTRGGRCPSMPTSAITGDPLTSERAAVTMWQEEIMDEKVFVIALNVSHMIEVGALSVESSHLPATNVIELEAADTKSSHPDGSPVEDLRQRVGKYLSLASEADLSIPESVWLQHRKSDGKFFLRFSDFHVPECSAVVENASHQFLHYATNVNMQRLRQIEAARNMFICTQEKEAPASWLLLRCHSGKRVLLFFSSKTVLLEARRPFRGVVAWTFSAVSSPDAAEMMRGVTRYTPSSLAREAYIETQGSTLVETVPNREVFCAEIHREEYKGEYIHLVDIRIWAPHREEVEPMTKSSESITNFRNGQAAKASNSSVVSTPHLSTNGEGTAAARLKASSLSEDSPAKLFSQAKRVRFRAEEADGVGDQVLTSQEFIDDP